MDLEKLLNKTNIELYKANAVKEKIIEDVRLRYLYAAKKAWLNRIEKRNGINYVCKAITVNVYAYRSEINISYYFVITDNIASKYKSRLAQALKEFENGGVSYEGNNLKIPLTFRRSVEINISEKLFHSVPFS